MHRIFISDLHLHASRPEITQAFQAFLENLPSDLNALYILGDFFDAWIGDDDDDPFVCEIASNLRSVSNKGIDIYFVHGNRDFLIGDAFCKKAGMQLLDEISTIEIGNKRAVILHGDELCTKDAEYMAFRHQVRSAAWQAHLLKQPLADRRALAKQLREKSAAMSSTKAEDIMDVTQSEVERVMQENHAHIMIHGHTHRPNRHAFSFNENNGERIVLGDWHHLAWCLDITGETIELRSWPIN